MIAQLIFYGILAATVIGGAWAFLSHEQGIGAAKQLAKDQPVMEACVADKKTALDANATLKADVDRMAAEQAAQNEAVSKLEKSSRDAIARAAKAQAGNASKVAALESDQAQLFRQAAGTLAKGLSCPQAGAVVTGDIHLFATREVRDRPPTAPATKPKRGGLSVQ
jgi:hypothetical protein